MKYLLPKIIISVLLGLILSTGTANANTARPSAKLALATNSIYQIDNRAIVLRSFLSEYDSPLAAHANTFITEADKHGLDWKLVTAIAGNESYFGHLIPYESNNAWGYGVYGNNVIRFSTWDEGIVTVSSAIKSNYIDKWGATNIYEIGAIYAEDPAWANKVSHFINLIDNYETHDTSSTISISI